MANVLHSALTGVELHEPKGVAAASSGEVYVADGAGSGAWTAQSTPVFMNKHIAGLTYQNGAGDPTNDITILAGTARDTANTEDLTLSSTLTKQLDAAWAVGSNAGGLDTGAIANGTYHIWLIKRTDTDVVDALFSASATAPTMPTNYTKKRRIGSFMRVSAAIQLFTQYEVEGGAIYTALTTPPAATTTATSATNGLWTVTQLPTGINFKAKVSVNAALISGTVAFIGDAALSGASSSNAPTIGAAPGWVEAISDTSAQLRQDDTGVGSFDHSLSGWTDFRRD